MDSIRSRIHNAGVASFPHDDLPIARIGIVQPHGVMAVTSAQGRAIEHVSANIEQILGVKPEQALGRDIAQLFNDPGARSAIEAASEPGRIYYDNPIWASCNGRPFEIVVHVQNGQRIFEIEPFVAPDRDYLSLVADATGKLSQQSSIPSLYRAAVDLLQAVTGYDRVMLYRFEGRGHGQVVAEKLGCDTLSFDQLYFPAADIPAEARRLLTNGKTRYTPCVTRPGSPMLTRSAQGEIVESGDAIDMTRAWLRGVHSCHNGYMSHISTKGSMVFPVIVDDLIWGLFVCHNGEEKYLDFESRIVVEQMTMMFICKLLELERVEARLDIRHEQLQRLCEGLASASELCRNIGGVAAGQRSRVHAETLAGLARDVANLAPGVVGTEYLRNEEGRPLSAFEQDLLAFVQADSAAVIRAGQVRLVGSAPSALEVIGLAAAFGGALPSLVDSQHRIWATNCLPSLLPSAHSIRGRACGLMAVPLDEAGRDVLMWFRREEVTDATWAGQPPSEEELRASSMNTPRSSFGRVALRIGGVSRDWTEPQALMAAEFGRSARLHLVGGRAAGAGALAERLEQAYAAPAAMDGGASEPLRIRTRETLGLHRP